MKSTMFINRLIFNSVIIGIVILLSNICTFAQETKKEKYEITSTVDLPNIMLNRPGSSFIKVNYKTSEGFKDFVEISGNEYHKYSKEKVQSIITEYEEFKDKCGTDDFKVFSIHEIDSNHPERIGKVDFKIIFQKKGESPALLIISSEQKFPESIKEVIDKIPDRKRR